MTVDEIMALADSYANAADTPDDWKSARAALRAAVEQLVREKDAYAENLDRLQQIWADNKPAVAYKERAERLAEQVKSLGGTPCA